MCRKNSNSPTWNLIPSEDRLWKWYDLDTGAEYQTGYVSYAYSVSCNTATEVNYTGTVISYPMTVKVQVKFNDEGWLDYGSDFIGSSTTKLYTVPAAKTDKVYFRTSYTNLNGRGSGASAHISGIKGHAYTIISGSANGVQTVQGKCTATYQRQTSFPVTGGGPFTVRVTRLTEDSTSSYVVNSSYFQTIAVVTNEKFSYPGFVMTGLYVDAAQYNSSHGYDFGSSVRFNFIVPAISTTRNSSRSVKAYSRHL